MSYLQDYKEFEAETVWCETTAVGSDDTTKVVGHKYYYVKADHITISGPDVPRKTMITELSTRKSVIQELMVLQNMNWI